MFNVTLEGHVVRVLALMFQPSVSVCMLDQPFLKLEPTQTVPTEYNTLYPRFPSSLWLTTFELSRGSLVAVGGS